MQVAKSATWRGLAVRVAPLVFAAGLAHLLYQIWKHWEIVTLDFRFFWLAGEFWLGGESPYGADFAAEAAAQFGITRGAIWYYPPNWFPLAAIFSLADPLTASRMWSIANAAMLLGACRLNVAAFCAMRITSGLVDLKSPIAQVLFALPPRTLFFLFTGLMAPAQATGNTLHLGQCSMLIYFGASLLMLGAVRSRLVPAAAGLAILMLKPQIGVLVCAGLVFTAFGRRAISAAAAISILAAAPAFISTPSPEFLEAFAGGLARYGDQAYNMPPAVTGLRHLVWVAGGADMGSAFYLILTLVLISAFGLFAQLRRAPSPAADFIAVAIAVTAAASPLHVYDLTILGAVALCAVSAPLPSGAVSLAAFALLWRAGNLPHPASFTEGDITYYAGSAYASLAALAIAGAVAFSSRGIRSVGELSGGVHRTLMGI